MSRLELLECLKGAIADATDARPDLGPDTPLGEVGLSSMDALIVWETICRQCQLPGLPMPEKLAGFTVADLLEYVQSHLAA